MESVADNLIESVADILIDSVAEIDSRRSDFFPLVCSTTTSSMWKPSSRDPLAFASPAIQKTL